MKGQAITSDPALAAAVVAQGTALSNVFKNRIKSQTAIAGEEAGILAVATRLHNVENKILEYLSNAQGVMQNLYQIKRAAELVSTEIPQNIILLKNSVKGHAKGTIFAAMVSKEVVDAYAQMASLFPLVQQLVTKGSYTTIDINGETKQKKINLLNSAERYYIANEIVTKLENLNMDLYLLAWQIQTMTFSDLFFALTPELWMNYMGGKAIVESIINDYKYL